MDDSTVIHTYDEYRQRYFPEDDNGAGAAVNTWGTPFEFGVSLAQESLGLVRARLQS